MGDSESYLRDREGIEALERGRLAVYAVSSGGGEGRRRYSEPEHRYRTCFQRDRDRVIHSAAFRRLEAKTQVFGGESSDYHRTRLTHTIEVAQVARTLARILAVNEDLAEAAALAHDLGHPPYGHCGEGVLNELMREHGGFEHNAHALRVVEFLEHPYPSFRGLNLMYETRECLAKHATSYDLPAVSEEYGSGFAPLEGQIGDVSDTIAYNSHDLDDALAAGLIHEDDLQEVTLYQRLKEQVAEQFPQARRHARQLRCAKAMIDLLINDALATTAQCLARIKPTSASDVRDAGERIVGLSGEGKRQLQQLEKFLFARVYQHPQVKQAAARAGEELRHLFAYYLADPARLPERYRQRVEEQGAHRVVCDYLAGMTDRFCRYSYEQSRCV